ncbi:hypothetical protein LZ318_03730 [Saccharopolyspora indica]|uniref:hypothetical protein n=1 Tax=Saccharopolyspora indica TaxID=1229659 RepID=UPI0022EB727A|nr:hypothetical protein [Saccharopolyspora indica]MDA3644962.1 hypothetical protein [Saccharopolyspora indica]
MGEQDQARHELLLRLAPLLPDDAVWQARRWLAAGQWAHAARLIAQTFHNGYEPMPPEAREVLLDGADPALTELISQIPDDARGAVVTWEFGAATGDHAVICADVVASYLASQPGKHTAWQARRHPEGDTARTGHLVHLVETQAGAEPHVLAAELADLLWNAGAPSPQVEVFHPESELDFYYHAAALVEGREIYAVGARPTIELARFDETNPHREPEGPDREAQIAYLDSGEPLTEEDALLPDLFADDEQPVVPVNLRTDGTWIWSDLTTYYLAHHGMALPPELRAHIAESGPKARTPTRREWVAMVALETQPT